MDRYYLLRGESDPKILGVDNGIKQAEIKRKGFKDPKKFDCLIQILGTNKYWSLKETINTLDIELQYVELLPKAKLTDFLQFGPILINCPFLISEKVVSIFSNYNISNHLFFDASVTDGLTVYKYCLPHFTRLTDNIIDFSRSIFYLGNGIVDKKFLRFSSALEKNDFSKNNMGLMMEEICLSKNLGSEMDFFVMGNGEMVVSERLKNELNRDLVSGVKLLPAFGDSVPWTKIYSAT